MTPEDQAQARCVLHPESAAEGTCARCGNFLCFTCNEAGRFTLCPTCRAQRSFPLRRENWTFDALWQLAWTRFQQEWVMLSVASLIIFGTSFVIGSVSQAFQMAAAAAFGDKPQFMAIAVGAVAVVTQIFSVFVQGVMQLGMYRICLDVLRGSTVDLGHFMRQARKLGTYVLSILFIFLIVFIPMLLVGAAIGFAAYFLFSGSSGEPAPEKIALLIAIPSLLLFVPFIWFVIPLTFSPLEIAIQDEVGPVQAVRNAFAVASGERLRIIGIMFAAGAIAIVGLMACCIGIVPAGGLANLLITGLYLSLRSGQVPGATPENWSTEQATSVV